MPQKLFLRLFIGDSTFIVLTDNDFEVFWPIYLLL